MSQVNLLPPEVKTKQRVRQRTMLAIGAAGAVVVLILGVYALQSVRLSQARRSLAAQQQTNRTLQGKITALTPFDQLQRQVDERNNLTETLASNQVLWSDALRNLSASLPGGLWLTSMDGSLNAVPPGTSPSATGQPVVGTIKFQGSAFAHTTVGSWLDRLEQVPGWVNAWVSSSAKSTDASSSTRTIVTFTASVDLAPSATTHRELP